MVAHEFILENFPKSIRDPKFNGKDLPNCYMTPCVDGVFQNFYYWDTYFINVGLIALGDFEMVKNNLNIMKHFALKYGFVPNADHLLKGSQPPLFTRGVYDLFIATKDINVIKDYIYACHKEMQFWENDRQTKIGLNQHKCGFTDEDCSINASYFVERVSGLNKIESQIDPIVMTKDFYAIAESGWDMNLRYASKGNRFAIHKFVCLDLNCILYDAEKKLSEMFGIINDVELINYYKTKSETRLQLINKYFLTKDGIYLDYNFVDDEHSNHISAASFYPYTFGISKDTEGAKKVFNLLKQEYGLTSSIEQKGEKLMQWDFPNIWPPLVYFGYLAYKNLGLEEEATFIAASYKNIVDYNFKKTNKLWEKYNALNSEVSNSFEYETPTMLGWTAGIYEYILKEGF